jgi:hypothetical protein
MWKYIVKIFEMMMEASNTYETALSLYGMISHIVQLTEYS